jgi:hypothetical protein
LQPSEEHPWDALCNDLNGHGVWSLDEALDKFKLRPVHAALLRALDADLLRCYSDLAETEAETADAKPVARASQAPCGRDDTFDALTKRAERFFREAMASVDGKGKSQPVADERYSEAQRKYRNLLEAAANVPQIEKGCARMWPPEARGVLPSYSPTVSAPAVWSPVAAWCLVSAFMELVPQERGRGDVFDKLYLRSVLADAFQPLGLEGDDAYRAAARVRLLVTEKDGKTREPRIPWDDPDVAWLTGLHEADGHRWFNKEGHERLVWWRLLPRLVDLAEKDPAGKSRSTSTALREIEAEAQKAAQSAEAAGYRLDELLRSFRAPEALPKAEKAPDPKAQDDRAELAQETAGRKS